MRILYVYDGSWPRGATRVRKQTMALAAAGHDVVLLARNEERAAAVQYESWMEVRRMPSVPVAAVNRLANFPFFLNPLWVGHIHRSASRMKADAILVEDLPLAPTALWVGRRLRIPVYYDMGEVYPEFLRGLWQFRRPSLVDRFVRNPAAADVIERHVLRRAAHVFVVSDESRDRAIERGADPRRISIVGNTPEDPAQLAHPAPVPAELAGLENRPVLLFTGILIFDRGVQHTVRAIERVRQDVPDVAFVIVGDGPDAPMIRAEVERLGLQDHVRMTGWVEHSRLTGFYQNADVGLLPFLNGGQIRFTLANKLFDYMGAGLPVLASDVPPMRRIVRETGAGELAPAGDPAGLAEALVRMLRRPAAERTEMGRRGADAVATTYNWAADARRLVAAVDAVNRSP